MSRVAGVGSRDWFFLSGFGCSVAGAEAKAVISGFKDMAVVGKPIEEGCGHFGVDEIDTRAVGLHPWLHIVVDDPFHGHENLQDPLTPETQFSAEHVSWFCGVSRTTMCAANS
jgi:hypothetical protein